MGEDEDNGDAATLYEGFSEGFANADSIPEVQSFEDAKAFCGGKRLGTLVKVVATTGTDWYHCTDGVFVTPQTLVALNTGYTAATAGTESVAGFYVYASEPTATPQFGVINLVYNTSTLAYELSAAVTNTSTTCEAVLHKGTFPLEGCPSLKLKAVSASEARLTPQGSTTEQILKLATLK